MRWHGHPNEVSDHKAPWDGQGFDSNWNCRHTLIQYNYSHHNEGGFLLICDNGGSRPPNNIGNIGTVVRYNVSVNDGVRRQPTRQGVFSPLFHISGPCRDTRIYNNLIYMSSKPTPDVDRTLLKMDNWGGPWPDSTIFSNNIFYTKDDTSYDFGQATGTVFENNLYFGEHRNRPTDAHAVLADPRSVGGNAIGSARDSLVRFRLSANSPCIGTGRIVLEEREEEMVDFVGVYIQPGKPPAIGPFEWVGTDPDKR